RRPATVARLVIAVVVDAVDGEAGLVSVGHSPLMEGTEVVPFLRDANATSAVAVVRAVVGIRAAVLHAGPHAVQAWACPVHSQPVTQGLTAVNFSCQAAATTS